jgi:hypothetical protein
MEYINSIVLDQCRKAWDIRIHPPYGFCQASVSLDQSQKDFNKTRYKILKLKPAVSGDGLNLILQCIIPRDSLETFLRTGHLVLDHPVIWLGGRVRSVSASNAYIKDQLDRRRLAALTSSSAVRCSTESFLITYKRINAAPQVSLVEPQYRIFSPFQSGKV